MNAHVAALKYLENGQQKKEFDVFNLGTGRGSSVLEVIQSFIRVTGISFDYILGPRREGDIIAAYASIDKTVKYLKWNPEYSLDDAVLSAWE